jgi:hypothetical protein
MLTSVLFTNATARRIWFAVFAIATVAMAIYALAAPHHEPN